MAKQISGKLNDEGSQAPSLNLAPTTGGHTPGPWSVEPQKHGAAHYDLHILADSACSAIATACDLYSKDDGALTRNANARLIAAAPKMLAALQSALLAMCTVEQTTEIAAAKYRARAAIGKATQPLSGDRTGIAASDPLS